MIFTARDYLPNSEKRVKHLQEIVAGRPVAILAAGPSIYELEHRIDELCDADICYFGLNSYTVQEVHILQKISKHFSVVMCSSREGIPKIIGDITNFLDRDEDNMFISSIWRATFELMGVDFDLKQFFIKYNKKLIFFSLDFATTFPNSNYPLHFIVSNSLLVLMQMAVIGKASSIVLFGADGGFKEGTEEWYHRQGDIGHRGPADMFKCDYIVGPKETLVDDTNKYFNPIAQIALDNLYKTYGFSPTEILNCSEDSFYTVFPKISYDVAIKHLLGEV